MLELIFNRWRGTGIIFWKINGNVIYAVYWAVLIGIFSTWYWGLLFAGLYVLGESFSWGKWVSYICFPENHEKEYDNKTGRGFPWIHYIANFFINQEKDYLNYCRLALGIRGFFWWVLPLLLIYFIDLIEFWQLIFGLFVVSVGFLLAADLSRLYNPHIVTKYFLCDNNWETQECIYGIFQFIGITLMIFI